MRIQDPLSEDIIRTANLAVRTTSSGWQRTCADALEHAAKELREWANANDPKPAPQPQTTPAP